MSDTNKDLADLRTENNHLKQLIKKFENEAYRESERQRVAIICSLIGKGADTDYIISNASRLMKYVKQD